MTMPWTCGAFEQGASQQFMRVSGYLDYARIDYADACELAAFLAIVDARSARWVFKWRPQCVKWARKIVAHLADDENVARMVHENRMGVDKVDGLNILALMKANGWHQGELPQCVRHALMDLRSDGLTMQAIADRCGLTHEQVVLACNPKRRLPRRAKPISLSNAALFAI